MITERLACIRPVLSAVASVVLMGCATCQGNNDACALLAVDAAIPVLLPVGVAAAVFRAASAPFDPVYPSFSTDGKEIAAVRRFEMPFTVSGIIIDDTGTVTGFPSRMTGQVAECVPDHPCALARTAALPPAPRPGCVADSPDGAYCLDISPSGRRLVAVSGEVVVATVPSTFPAVGLATVSERGEVFSPAADGGYDRTNADDVRHHPPLGTKSIFVARLGRQDRLLAITGSDLGNSPPQALHLLDTGLGTDREVAVLVLPSHAVFLYGLKLSRDGGWCAITVSPEGHSTQVELFRLDAAGIRPIGIFTAPNTGPRLVFSPSGVFVAVIGSGDHDRETQRRVSIYRLDRSVAAPGEPPGKTTNAHGG